MGRDSAPAEPVNWLGVSQTRSHATSLRCHAGKAAPPGKKKNTFPAPTLMENKQHGRLSVIERGSKLWELVSLRSSFWIG